MKRVTVQFELEVPDGWAAQDVLGVVQVLAGSDAKQLADARVWYSGRFKGPILGKDKQ